MAKILKNMFNLEGIDGSGKTTQIPLIKKSLERAGFTVHIFKNPSTSMLGEFIRKNVKSFDPWLRNRLFVLDMQATLMDQKKFMIQMLFCSGTDILIRFIPLIER